MEEPTQTHRGRLGPLLETIRRHSAPQKGAQAPLGGSWGTLDFRHPKGLEPHEL